MIHATVLELLRIDRVLENVYAIVPQWRQRYVPCVTHNTERVFGLQGTPGRFVSVAAQDFCQRQALPMAALMASFRP
jgi:dATP pyrophosphohydrolase